MSKNVYLFYFSAKIQLFIDTNKKMCKIHIGNCLLLKSSRSALPLDYLFKDLPLSSEIRINTGGVVWEVFF